MLNNDVLKEFTGKTEHVNYTSVNSRFLMHHQTMATKQTRFLTHTTVHLGFLGGSMVKNPPTNVGDTGLIPGSGRSPGEEMTIHSNILAWEIP